MRAIWFPAFCLGAICSCMPLFARSDSYHVELSNKTNGLVILVNDSDKTIEAFHISSQCAAINATGSAGNVFTYDALDDPHTNGRTSFLGPDGKLIVQGDAIEPKGRMVTMVRLLSQPSGCAWRGNADAIIYADGSYEGNKMVVKGIAARRDGIVAGVAYWAEKLNSGSDISPNLGAIRTDAERLTQEDWAHKKLTTCNSSPFACEYWAGRLQVDESVAMWLHNVAKDGTPDKAYKKTSKIVEGWQKKIDNNVALKKLDAVFPNPIR